MNHALKFLALFASLLMMSMPSKAQNTYAVKCNGCHGAINSLSQTGTGLSGALRAANNPAYLAFKYNNGMGGLTVSMPGATATDFTNITNEIGLSTQKIAPSFTSAAPPTTGTVNTPYSHTVSATGAPLLLGNFGLGISTTVGATTFTTPAAFRVTSGALPTGLALDGSTGAITGTPTVGGLFTGTITANNQIAAAPGQAFSITIAKLNQTISFTAQTTPRAFVLNGPFTVSPVPTATSGLTTFTYGTSTPAVCGVSGTTVTMLTAGTCTITAFQPGNTQYNATSTASQSVVLATAPGAPTGVTAMAGNAQATVSFATPASDGGAPITGYTVTSIPAGGGDTNAGTTGLSHIVNSLVNGTPYTFTVRATNIAGQGTVSAASSSVTPVAPIFIVSVNSRKTHTGIGALDVLIDHTIASNGLVSVEPRNIGSGHLLVFTFSGPVSVAGTVTTTVGTATTPLASVNDVLVTLTSVPDQQRVTVSLSGVNGTASATATMGFHVGDVSSSRAVNASDISGVKARIGQTVNGTTARFDINASGAIDGVDVSAVKARSGQVLP